MSREFGIKEEHRGCDTYETVLESLRPVLTSEKRAELHNAR